MQAAALVGHQVMVPGGGLQLTGDSGAVGGIELGASADQVTITIKDANGIV
jgi:flagellar basal-body rod modification protein FlgD